MNWSRHIFVAPPWITASSGYRRRVALHHEQAHLLVVQPFVEEARWEGFVGAGAVLAVLAFLCNLLHTFFVGSAGEDFADEQDLLAVRAPLRHARAQRQGGHALCFTDVGYVEAVDLRRFVAFALGDEQQDAAVRRPGVGGFAVFAEGQAARGAIVRQRFDPDVGPLFLAVVGGIGDGEHGPFAIRAGLRGADALHQTYFFVGDGVPGRFGGRRLGQGRRSLRGSAGSELGEDVSCNHCTGFGESGRDDGEESGGPCQCAVT